MDAECYLVQPNQHGKIKYLHLVVEDDTMTSSWGQLGGAEQETSNTYDYINEGKSNELSPEEAAQIALDGAAKEGVMLVGDSPTGQFTEREVALSGDTLELPPLSLTRLRYGREE